MNRTGQDRKDKAKYEHLASEATSTWLIITHIKWANVCVYKRVRPLALTLYLSLFVSYSFYCKTKEFIEIILYWFLWCLCHHLFIQPGLLILAHTRSSFLSPSLSRHCWLSVYFWLAVWYIYTHSFKQTSYLWFSYVRRHTHTFAYFFHLVVHTVFVYLCFSIVLSSSFRSSLSDGWCCRKVNIWVVPCIAISLSLSQKV